MTREEKCKLAIERGYTYNSETGIIYSRLGKIVNIHLKYLLMLYGKEAKI